jgi:adenylyltransferase/sulfurtransferase
MRFHTIEVARDPACPACGTREIQTLIDYEAYCGLTVSGAPPAAPAAREGEGEDITPRDLASALASRQIALVDVRESYEWSIGHLPGARLVPLDTLPQMVDSLDRETEMVVYCHHGMRSDMAAEWLRERGFGRVRNLIGGIDRWSLEVDPSVRRY